MSATPGAKPDKSDLGVPFDQVFEHELRCVEARWETVYGKQRQATASSPTTANNLVGLAFSGGGIRSATINMGIAQALHRRGVFDHVDYLSTVSGGGYLGSSISTAMRELPDEGDPDAPEGKGEFPYAYQDPEKEADPSVAGEPRKVETPFLTWVRNNSNYMATGGLLDWPRIFGVLLRGMLANALVLLPLLLALAVGLVWFHGDMLAGWAAQDLELAGARQAALEATSAAELAERLAVGGGEAALERLREAQTAAERAAREAAVQAAKAPALSSFFPWAVAFAGIFMTLVLVFPVFIRVYKVYQHGEVEESTVESRGWVEIAFGLILLLILVALAVEVLPLLIRWFHKIESTGVRGLVAGAGSGGALGVITAAGKLLSSLGGLKQKIALFLVGLLGLVLPLVGALYVADDLIYFHPEIEANASPDEVDAAIAEARAQTAEGVPAYKVVSHPPMELTNPFGDTGAVRLLPGLLLIIMGGGLGAAAVGKLEKGKLRALFALPGILLGAALGYLLLIASFQGLAALCRLMGVDGIRPDILVLTMGVVVFLFCWAAIDVNLTGVLGLYRDRLAAAYLIGVRKKKNGAESEEIFVEPDLNLEDLCGGTPPPEKASGDEAAKQAAVCCHRSKAPYHIVNTALNLQGSSDPMLRDRGSDFFMFSKLYYGGHRTGYCRTGMLEQVYPQMDLPTAMAISAAAASPNAGRMTSKPLVALMTLLNVRLGYWVPHPGRLCAWLAENEIEVPEIRHRWRWRVPPWALLREMASGVNEEHKWVNLSDGGHIENMAVYELLRRRCKYIICGDGEADPTLSFGGLAILMRSARIDMGIEIEILLDDLRLDDNGKSHQHAALGRIRYPPLFQGGKAEEGYLLYIKSSFTGNEDETMQEYRACSPDFPHESTADQFFDEGQFEAYRALGFHMADGLFPARQPGEKLRTYEDWNDFSRWFDKLRADLAPRLSAKHAALQDQLRRISKLLRREQYHAYFYELNPKLDTDGKLLAEARAQDKQAKLPELNHLVGQQLDLMENAFVSLDLDQPQNWWHEGNQGWRKLFLDWAESETFKSGYLFNIHLHSGRFQNFCERTLKLPPPDWEAMLERPDDSQAS